MSKRTDEKHYLTQKQDNKHNKALPSATTSLTPPTDEISHGTHRELFHSSSFVTHMEDAANNFARGRYTVGKAMINKVLDGIRKQVEACSGLQVRKRDCKSGGFLTLFLFP